VVAPPPVVAASGGGRRRALMVVVALLFLAALVTVIARVNRGANTNTYSGGYYGSNSSASGKPSNAGYGSYSTPTPGPAAPSVPTFTGYVGDTSGMRRFGTFLENSQREVVKIDVNLSDEQMSSLRSEGSGRLYIDLAYTDSDGYPEGDELMIDVSGGMGDLYLDERGTSQRLQGYIKVLGVQGPQQGIFSVLAKPVAIESIGRGGK
jgi:hypothetical protein